MAADEQKTGNFSGLRRQLRLDGAVWLVIMLALGLGLAAFFALSGIEDVSRQSDLLTIVFGLGALVLLVLAIVVGRQLVSLWRLRRSGRAGAQLHLRLAVLFGGLTVIPSVLVALFAVSVVDYSLRGWFAERISTAVSESVTIADAYLEEHSRSVRGQILAMANDINREAPRLLPDPMALDRFIDSQTGIRNLSEAVIVDGTGQIQAKSQFAFALSFVKLQSGWLERARSGEVVVVRTPQDNKLQAVVKLNSFVDAYLVAGRFIDAAVLAAVDQTRLAASDYQSLSFAQTDIQISMAVLFVVLALMLLLGALWVGLGLANSIVEPIGRVIAVADEVRGGNLSPRLAETGQLDEIDRLGASLNRMLNDLSSSQEQLVQANRQLDQRREFTEAVLAGASSGVIGLDRNGVVTLPNQAACRLLDMSAEALYGARLADKVPAFAPLLSQIDRGKKRLREEQIALRAGARTLTVQARLTVETVEGRIIGFVVTFDDVTALLSAQRKAAWSDIARRIAHEIKNPLTPIGLAADRLVSKYRPQDEKEGRNFEQTVSIISRQVEDIGRMVDEFSHFARMPTAVLEKLDFVALLEGQAQLVKEGSKVPLSLELPEGPLPVLADAGLMRQAITNLISNAQNILQENQIENPQIRMVLTVADGQITLVIADNGPGFPEMDLEELFEPYVTTREKGTGLGLSIVQKIISEHGGEITLANSPSGGAEVTLTLPAGIDQNKPKNRVDRP